MMGIESLQTPYQYIITKYIFLRDVMKKPYKICSRQKNFSEIILIFLSRDRVKSESIIEQPKGREK